MSPDIIKQQQEVALEKFNSKFGITDSAKVSDKILYDLHRLFVTEVVAEAIANTLITLCEELEMMKIEPEFYQPVSLGLVGKDYINGRNEALTDTITLIRSITGISPTR